MADVPEVVELLERYLALARKCPFGHVAIAMVGYGAPLLQVASPPTVPAQAPPSGHADIACCDYAGDISLEKSQKEAVQILNERLSASIANWTLPSSDAWLDASHVVYNVANGPLGYDFIVWLIDAEMTRVREGAPAPLKVAFWLGRDADSRMQRDQRRQWLDNVFRPALALIGAVESTTISGRHKEVFVSRDIVAAAKAGERVPRLKGDAIGSLNVVTITLREAEHWSERNSNLPAWIRFATDLRNNGEEVVFIRDTAKADEPLADFTPCIRAPVDLRYRMTVYEAAKANLFVSNGPATLAVFSDRPWLQFVHVEPEGSDYRQNTAQFWKDSMGVAPGEQYPWSNERQRIVWAKDHYENIVAAWREHFEQAEAA
jgi:hypothetical protein